MAGVSVASGPTSPTRTRLHIIRQRDANTHSLVAQRLEDLDRPWQLVNMHHVRLDVASIQPKRFEATFEDQSRRTLGAIKSTAEIRGTVAVAPQELLNAALG